MRRFVFSLLLLVLIAAPGAANDTDYELANALVERGWLDLAEELYQKIEKNGATADAKVDGTFGLLRLQVRKAKSESDPKKRLEAYEAAGDKIQKFVDANKNHPRRAEALADLGDLRQEKGRYLIELSKTDPSALEKAEKEFDAAEKIFTDQMDELARNAVPRPEDPEKDKAGMVKYEAWEQKMMFAKYNKGVSMFQRAEAYRENPDKHAEMKKKLTDMITFFKNDFMWLYEWYLLAYDAFIYMGRALQILAEYADRAEAEKYWTECFANIGKAKGLLTDPEARKNEVIRDLAMRGYMWEIKARLVYGDTKKGAAAAREYMKAAKLAEELFRVFPNTKKEEIGKQIQLEQAKAYCKAGETKKGVDLLLQLKALGKGTRLEDFVIDILGEYAGENDLKLAIESADNIFERGEAWLYRAMQKYRRALGAIKNEAERTKYLPYCWYQIARCYYYLGRYHEAAAACSQFVYDRSPYLNHDNASDAAILKLDALLKVSRQTKDPMDTKAATDFNAFVASKYPDKVGDGPIYNAALDAEGRKDWAAANKQWEQLANKPRSTYYEVALFSLGQNLYNQGMALLIEISKDPRMNATDKNRREEQCAGYFDQALKWFEKHLAHVEKGAKDNKTVKNAVGSIHFSCKIHLRHPKNRQPLKALQISDGLDRRFPTADPKFVIAILTSRLDAKLQLDLDGQAYCPECKAPVKVAAGAQCTACKKVAVRSYIEEAEDDMRALEKKYETEGVGLADYLRALAIIAQNLEKKALDIRGTDAALAKEYVIRAAEYYYVYYQKRPPTETFVGEQLEAIAEKLFFAAEERLARASKIADPAERAKMDEDARTLFGKSKDLFEQYLLEVESTLEPAKVKILKRQITRASVKSGQFDQAIRNLEEVLRGEDPASPSDGSAWEDLADCYYEKAKAMAPSGDRVALIKKADNIFATLASSLMSGNRINEHFYRLVLKHSACLWHYDPDKLDNFFILMDGRGYGKRYACEKCRRILSLADVKGGACVYERCKTCSRSYKAGTTKECLSCKGPVEACANSELFEIAWDDRIRSTCATAWGCANWRCGNVLREYAMKCTSCNYEMVSGNPLDQDCPKCSGTGTLLVNEFKKFVCTECGDATGGDSADRPGRDCGKCNTKGTVLPLCLKCETSTDLRRSKCTKCGEWTWPRYQSDKTTCAKNGCGGELKPRPDALVLLGCGAKFDSVAVDDMRRMKCTACEMAFLPSRDLERTGACDNSDCPAKGKGRLRDVLECGKCKKLETIRQIELWTKDDWQAGKSCDEFESWRKLVVDRVKNTKRPPTPNATHVHGQNLMTEEQLLGGSK